MPGRRPEAARLVVHSVHQPMGCQPSQGTSDQDLNNAALVAEQSHSGAQRNQRRRPVELPAEALRPEDVVAEEQGKVEDHPHDSGRDTGQRCRNFSSPTLRPGKVRNWTTFE